MAMVDTDTSGPAVQVDCP